MATIDNLKPSLTRLGEKEIYDLIRTSRENRRKRKPKAVRKQTINVDKMIDGLSSEAQLKLLKRLEER